MGEIYRKNDYFIWDNMAKGGDRFSIFKGRDPEYPERYGKSFKDLNQALKELEIYEEFDILK